MVHPNGKVLIQCNCYNISTPITVVNDTDFKFFTSDKAEIQLIPPKYVDISKSAILWLLIAIVILWSVFGWIGYKRDGRSLKRHKIIGPSGK